MITAFIKGQSIEIAESIIVAESFNYLKAQFVFSTNDWSDLKKTAYFTQGGKSYPYELDENNVAFPLNILAGEYNVSVIGREYANGELVERITSDSASIEIKPFKGGTETTLPDVTPTEAENISAKIGYLESLLTKNKTNLVDAINEVYRRGGAGGGGTDGFSPIIDITEITGGHRVTITDIEGTKSFDILNGVDGKDGEKGEKGDKGDKGEDGNDYVLTSSDKTEIANNVIDLLQVAEGGAY